MPIVASKVVSLTTENQVALEPPKLTFVVPVKLMPFMVIVSPLAAVVGVKELTTGLQSIEIVTTL